MYTVKQTADQLNVTAETIRYYSRLGIVEPQRDPENGYRYYTDNDIRKINFILKAKHYCLTINEIGVILNKSSKGESPCRLVIDMVTNHHTKIRKKIKELQELEGRLTQALLDWTVSEELESDLSLICPLIENYDVI